MAQVERDVMRTHPDMHFFTGESQEAELHRQVNSVDTCLCKHKMYRQVNSVDTCLCKHKMYRQVNS
jgi:hypothetical protein